MMELQNLKTEEIDRRINEVLQKYFKKEGIERNPYNKGVIDGYGQFAEEVKAVLKKLPYEP